MKVGVVVFPGSNCDQDMVKACETDLGLEVVQLWHKNATIDGCDLVILPGGFSYGDYLRSGAIAAIAAIMPAVKAHAEAGGFVLGVCNGFQILTEAGLLPGALVRNESQKFRCENIYLKAEGGMQESLKKEAYKIPIAHADGRYVASEATLAEMEANGQILFRYVDASGALADSANPNGSVGAIAGVSNAAGNVIGMMPHPERASNAALGNTDGLAILKALVALVGSKTLA